MLTTSFNNIGVIYYKINVYELHFYDILFLEIQLLLNNEIQSPIE